jgi:hypothetical protein
VHKNFVKCWWYIVPEVNITEQILRIILKITIVFTNRLDYCKTVPVKKFVGEIDTKQLRFGRQSKCPGFADKVL